uniref:F-box/LRR-repeat protein 4-like n=1 Tax=Crassostrea virginica TaxID=6565 RepID=A0A8B8D1M8_CRAVI|nr:F-box/LRR-repeat protein 4-like [Crassostrea virginica]
MKVLVHVFVWILTYIHGSQCNIHLWASEVTRFSSQYNNGSFSANQILGNPNVYPRYGAIAGTWAQPNGQLDRVHFIEIKFPRKLFLNKINIFETYNAGAVVRIAAKDPQNQWVDVYHARHAHLIRKSRKFSPKIKEVQFPVDELRIEVDCSVSRDYVEIDAVEIIGGRCPGHFKEYRNSCYLIKKDTISGDKAFDSRFTLVGET